MATNRTEIKKMQEEALMSQNKDKWDTAKRFTKPDNVNIENQKLENKDYSKWDFSRIILNGCNFKKCRFIDCNMQDTQFVNCTFIDCDLSNILYEKLSKETRSVSGWKRCDFYKCY